MGKVRDIQELVDYHIDHYSRWQYKNTALLVVSLIVLYYFAGSHIVQNTIKTVGSFGYIGAFITGIFFVSTFTVAPAILVLFNLATQLNAFEVALLAGLGAVVGDFVIFRFVEDNIVHELAPIFRSIKGSYIGKMFRTPYFGWLLPLLGAAIIASPLPDEMGIGILGISRMKKWQFIFLSFFLNFAGIFIIVTLASSV